MHFALRHDAMVPSDIIIVTVFEFSVFGGSRKFSVKVLSRSDSDFEYISNDIFTDFSENCQSSCLRFWLTLGL